MNLISDVRKNNLTKQKILRKNSILDIEMIIAKIINAELIIIFFLLPNLSEK